MEREGCEGMFVSIRVVGLVNGTDLSHLLLSLLSCRGVIEPFPEKLHRLLLEVEAA